MAHRKTRKHRIIEPGPKVCHPKTQGDNGNCLTDMQLSELSVAYGAPPNLHGHQLRSWLTKKTRCKTERCWLERAPIDSGKKTSLIKENFRPTMPDEWISDPDKWLDSNNIDNVMKQYEEVYKEFKYYGSSPIDFSAPDPYNADAAAKNKCLEDDICKMKFKDLLGQGKTKLGFVFNLDPSNKGGSHWVASFIDIPAHKAYYFDSYGMKPPPQVARFMRSLTLQDQKMSLGYNARRFQYGETECGMYCLYFLIRMLAGDNFRRFCRKAPRDHEMLFLRKWLFSPKNE